MTCKACSYRNAQYFLIAGQCLERGKAPLSLRGDLSVSRMIVSLLGVDLTPCHVRRLGLMGFSTQGYRGEALSSMQEHLNMDIRAKNLRSGVKSMLSRTDPSRYLKEDWLLTTASLSGENQRHDNTLSPSVPDRCEQKTAGLLQAYIRLALASNDEGDRAQSDRNGWKWSFLLVT